MSIKVLKHSPTENPSAYCCAELPEASAASLTSCTSWVSRRLRKAIAFWPTFILPT
ncbi:hypothetical protein [Microcoleus sp.]|uniref:hypothetical protein n=1 Tax=Microcoleus sp. TaxID=44472 RepID=UPI0035939BE2